ncbi:hypothetical protein J5N97_014522 [Dioscorea zingiberensis]|uniref:Uncharacterized protein n=1 Tax=Dioscorea zingiberensis TaxID=325984 RepID=A0A9D5CTM0_9LILI|nr:hypothetical protein J5N97_014522 [Dioscorea zingiberensis]
MLAGPLEWFYPPDSDPNCRNLNPFEGSTSGSHALLNGKFSASRSPIIGDLMLELPSFQYPETDSSSWLSHPSTPLQPIQTHVQPPPATVPDCASSHNSGLLEDLLHEAKTFCNSIINHLQGAQIVLHHLPSSIAESSLPDLVRLAGKNSMTQFHLWPVLLLRYSVKAQLLSVAS